MFPKMGSNLQAPVISGIEPSEDSYAFIVGNALRESLGGSHRAIKTLMRWTGASERTAKNWCSGKTGPNGDYLILLIGQSDAVLEAVLTASDRGDLVDAMHILRAQGTITAILEKTLRRQAKALANANIAFRIGP